MRKCKKVKIGDIVQFPYYQFAPYRSGWNGWLFRPAIVQDIYINNKGEKCAVLKYQADRKEYAEVEMKIRCEYIFEFDAEWTKREFHEFNIKGEGYELLSHNGLI